MGPSRSASPNAAATTVPIPINLEAASETPVFRATNIRGKRMLPCGAPPSQSRVAASLRPTSSDLAPPRATITVMERTQVYLGEEALALPDKAACSASALRSELIRSTFGALSEAEEVASLQALLARFRTS